MSLYDLMVVHLMVVRNYGCPMLWLSDLPISHCILNKPYGFTLCLSSENEDLIDIKKSRGSVQGQKISKKDLLKCSNLARQLVMGVGLQHCRRLTLADKMDEEVVQVEKIACFLGSWQEKGRQICQILLGQMSCGQVTHNGSV